MLGTRVYCAKTDKTDRETAWAAESQRRINRSANCAMARAPPSLAAPPVSDIVGSRPSCSGAPSFLFRVRVEARRAKARGPKGRELECGLWRVASPSPLARGPWGVHSRGAKWPLLELVRGQVCGGMTPLAPVKSAYGSGCKWTVI